LAWETPVSLGVTMIWFRDIFKTTGKNHPCRHIDVGHLAKIAGCNHEEMDGDANGQRAVPTGRAVSNKV
jgi:hypothetical protein